MGVTRSDPSALERAAFTVPEFCFRNRISRQKYNEMRSNGRGPAEMRLGINTIRITAKAERDWQRQMQEPQLDIEQRAAERAVKAGDAAAKSPKHVSKKRRRQRGNDLKRRDLKNEPDFRVPAAVRLSVHRAERGRKT